MFAFDKSRQQISKKRKPPQKRLAPVVSVIVYPPSPRQFYENARAIKKAENLSAIETLIRTGYWVDGD